MTRAGYSVDLITTQDRGQVFEAINDVRSWWSEEVDGDPVTAGAEFTLRSGEMHRTRIEVTELIPDERIVWRVIDNHFSFVDDQTEWNGTEIIFELSEQSEETALHFTHMGLLPQHECFDVCSQAWEFKARQLKHQAGHFRAASRYGRWIRADTQNRITSGDRRRALGTTWNPPGTIAL